MAVTREQLYQALQRADAAGDTAAARAIAQRLATMPANEPALQRPVLSTPSPDEEPVTAADGASGWEAFKVFAGKAAHDFGQGARQIAGFVGDMNANSGFGRMWNDKIERETGIDLNARAQANNAYADERYAEELRSLAPLREAHPVASFAGEIAPQMVIPGSAARSLAQRAATNAGIAMATEAAKWKPSAKQRAADATLAGAFSAGVTTLFGALGKGINALRRVYSDSKAARLATELEQIGIPHSYADVAPATAAANSIRKIDEYLSQVPFVGTGGRAARQLDAVTSHLTGIKDRLLAQLGGQTPEEVIENSVEAAANSARAKAGQMFDDVRNLAGSHASNTPALALAHQQMSQRLANMADDVRNMGENKARTALLSTIKPGQPRTFQGLRDLRDVLGDKIESAMRGSADTPSFLAKELTQLKSAVERDIDRLLTQTAPAARTAYGAAKKFFQENVVPLRQRGLVRDINTGRVQPDAIIDRVVRQNRWVEARRLYDAVDARGKTAIDYAFVERALTNAERTFNGRTVYDPGAFASSIARLSKAMGNVMSKPVRQEVQGAARLMKYLYAASKFANSPNTGFGAAQSARQVGTAAAGAAAIAAGGAYTQAAGIGAGLALTFRALFGTEAGKRYLLAASHLEPKSAAMRTLWQSAERFGQRVANGVANNNIPDDDE